MAAPAVSDALSFVFDQMWLLPASLKPGQVTRYRARRKQFRPFTVLGTFVEVKIAEHDTS